eukprot:53494_1
MHKFAQIYSTMYNGINSLFGQMNHDDTKNKIIYDNEVMFNKLQGIIRNRKNDKFELGKQDDKNVFENVSDFDEGIIEPVTPVTGKRDDNENIKSINSDIKAYNNKNNNIKNNINALNIENKKDKYTFNIKNDKNDKHIPSLPNRLDVNINNKYIPPFKREDN